MIINDQQWICAGVIMSRADNSEAADDWPWPPTRWRHDTYTTISALHSHHCWVQRLWGQ